MRKQIADDCRKVQLIKEKIMGEEFKDFEVEAPVLTLEPDLTEEKATGTCSGGTGVISTGTENCRRFCGKDRY